MAYQSTRTSLIGGAGGSEAVGRRSSGTAATLGCGGMALHLRPVGPLPAATYWTRRAGVLLALLVLLLLLRACGGGDDPSSLEQTGGASPSPSATVREPGAGEPVAQCPGQREPGRALACPDASIDVTAATARESYPVGGSPVLQLTVTNTGTVACTRPLGQGAVELTVFSGSDRIWSSDDCTPGGPPGPVQLAPGEARTTTLTWSGRRSRPGCTGDKERGEAGTYRPRRTPPPRPGRCSSRPARPGRSRSRGPAAGPAPAARATRSAARPGPTA